MNRIEFIQRTARSAGHAHAFSTRELIESRLHQGLPKALLKTAYARTAGALLAPRAIEINGEVHSILSGGSEQLVYATAQKVAKVVVGSLTFNRDEAERKVAELRTNQGIIEPYMGEHVVQTAYDTKRFRSGLFAAIALQPRLRAEKEFDTVEEMLMYRDDEAYMDQLRSLFEALTQLYAAQGLQMDLNGRKNIFLLNAQGMPNLKIIDSIVVTPDLQAIVDRTQNISTGQTLLAQVGKLQTHLGIAANPAA